MPKAERYDSNHRWAAHRYRGRPRERAGLTLVRHDVLHCVCERLFVLGSLHAPGCKFVSGPR